MDDLLNRYYEIENQINEKRRYFIYGMEKGVLTWKDYEQHERNINKYHGQIQDILHFYKPNLLSLVNNQDSEIRRVALKLTRNGFPWLTQNNLFITALLKLAILGNDDERYEAQEILIIRDWLKNRWSLIKSVIQELYSENLDYFLYKDIGDFICTIKNKELLIAHIDKGKFIQDSEANELIEEYSEKLTTKI